MAGVDLNRFVFDYDLTLAVLFLDPGGRVLHHYGNRDASGAESHLSMESLLHVMRRARIRGARAGRGDAGAAAPDEAPPVSIEMLPTMRERVARGRAPECFHCHMVWQAHDEDAHARGTFDRNVVWRWPDSMRVGLSLDAQRQNVVERVVEDSPAARAGLRPGDVVTQLGGRVVASQGDVQAALHDVPWDGGELAVTVTRAGASGPGAERVTTRATLHLAEGWRRGRLADLAWRASMWRLGPWPGFGGRLLDAAQRAARGVGEDEIGLRVGYLVTWGPRARTGRSAAKAGLRKNDVVLSCADAPRFAHEREFQTWFRLNRAPGESVRLRVLRGERRLELVLPVVE